MCDDPVLQMRGLGKEIWSDTTADEYVAELRSGWDEEDREVVLPDGPY